MTDKNSDVDRAIASIGGEPWAYRSFAHAAVRPSSDRHRRLFTYNDLGEPEYTPEEAAPVQALAKEAVFLEPAPLKPNPQQPEPQPQQVPVRSPALRYVAAPRPVAAPPRMTTAAPISVVAPLPVVTISPVSDLPAPGVHVDVMAPAVLDAPPPLPAPTPARDPAPPSSALHQFPPAYSLLAAALPSAAGSSYTPRYRQPVPQAVPEWAAPVPAAKPLVAPTSVAKSPVVPAPPVAMAAPLPAAPVGAPGPKSSPAPTSVIAETGVGMFRRI